MNAPLPSPDRSRYAAVLRRDRAADGVFVYAVVTTGVFCRPACPARAPRPENVRFFSSPREAIIAGFRPCKRCRPEGESIDEASARRVARARERLELETPAPSLEILAREAGWSVWHFQRTFRRIVGMTPRAYAAAHRLKLAEEGLRDGDDVTRAAAEAGYGSSARFYSDAGALGMSPSELRRGAAGIEIRYTFRTSRLGLVVVAATARGVAAVLFGEGRRDLEAELRERFPRAIIERDDRAVGPLAERIATLADTPAWRADIPLDLLGTDFQLRVWRELSKLGPGETVTYAELARRIGKPGAARAVGTACGQNPCAVVVPCHRVLQSDGSLGGYRWGLARKGMLLS